jgi:hypothetical protein
MGRLFLAEIERIWFRRLVRVLVILAMAGALLSGIIVFFQSNSKAATETFRLVEFEDVLLGTSVMIIVLGWVVGATGVGAEWSSRSMTTLLTWESRRVRVLATKIAAAVLMAFAISMFLQLWLLWMLTPAAVVRGSTEGIDGAWLADVVEVMARIGFVAAMGGAMGAALAFIGRNTAAALGVAFAYLAIVEGLIRGLKPAWQKFLIGDNAASVISGAEDIIPGRSAATAALWIAAYALLLAVAAGTFFRARDVA